MLWKKIIIRMKKIKRILTLKKVGIVGISRHSAKAAHFVPKYLSEQGYDITPINPNADKILGKKCYPDISSYRTFLLIL